MTLYHYHKSQIYRMLGKKPGLPGNDKFHFPITPVYYTLLHFKIFFQDIHHRQSSRVPLQPHYPYLLYKLLRTIYPLIPVR